MSVRVFISHAHADQELYKKLEEHLSLLKYAGEITIWQDQEILAGADWEDQIITHLNEADIILLLISSSFIASEYCWHTEAQIALERHIAGTAKVIPVILKPTNLRSTPLGRLQALPTGAKPVILWNNLDTAFEDVVRGIRKVMEHLPITLQTEAQRNEHTRGLTSPPPLSEEPATHTSTISLKRGGPRRRIVPILLMLIVLLMGGGGAAATMLRIGESNSICVTGADQLHGIGVVKTDAGECIGLSDGTVAFDVDQPGRTDSVLKQQAAAKLAAGDRKEVATVDQKHMEMYGFWLESPLP